MESIKQLDERKKRFEILRPLNLTVYSSVKRTYACKYQMSGKVFFCVFMFFVLILCSMISSE